MVYIKGGIAESKRKKTEGEQELGYAKWMFELSKEDVSIAGGKGASLAEMYTAKFPVPPAFIISAQTFEKFIEEVSEQIRSIVEHTDVDDTAKLNESSKKIRGLIESQEFPEDMEKEILEAYEILGTDKRDPHISKDALGILRVAKEPVFVAIRSSATTEDLAEASFAGQQETFLNVKGNSQLLSAIKKCFSSLYTPRAIYYRNKQGFKNSKALLAVVVQKMINSDKSGVMFTKNPMQDDDSMIIEAVFGLGEGIVSGQINPDSYKVNSDLEILEKVIADKKKAIVRSGAGETEGVKLTEERSVQQVLTEGQIKEIANTGLKIEKHYGTPQDVEFAIEDGQLYIVQSRPITTLGKIKKKAAEIKGKILLSGLAASPGIASGKVKLVKTMEDLPRVKKGDILVTEMTNPDMVVTMQRSDAIITDEGGATSHAAIVSREMGIPCVVGTKEATSLLKEGQLVTVDGAAGKVYEGAVGEEEKKEILAVENANTKTKIKVIVDLPDFAERAAESKCTAVGLLRLEGIIAESGKHPLKFLEEDKIDDYSELIRRGVEKIAEHFDSIWVRASDIRTDEFRNLEGSPEKVEMNPMLGLHGVRFLLRNLPILGAELNAIKKLAEKYPIKKFGIMFPQVISVREVVEARKEFSKIKTDNMEFGIMIETPAAVQIIDELCNAELDFISLGTNDLTQYTLAVDRNNPLVQDIYNEQHPAVLRQMEKVIETCKKNGVKTSICGQAGSDPKMVKFLVSKGINSITVNADAANTVAALVQEFEGKLEEEEIKSHVEQVTREIIAGEKEQGVTKEIEKNETPEIAAPDGYERGVEVIDNLEHVEKKAGDIKKEIEKGKRVEEAKEKGSKTVDTGADIFEGVKPQKGIEEAEEKGFIITETPKTPKNSLLSLINTDFLYTPEFRNIQKAIESKIEQIKRGKLESELEKKEEEKEEKEISKIDENILKVEEELLNLPFLDPIRQENEELTVNNPEISHGEESKIVQEKEPENEVLDIF